MAATLPAAALAASPAAQELSDALRARPNVYHGAELFKACATCHGRDGGGQSDGSVPRIAGQYREVIIDQLVDFRHGQRWDIRMERYTDEHNLKDAQAIADVAAYASSLKSRQEVGVGSGELVQHGADVYARQCRSCHGKSGEGSASRGVPRLAGQHFEYILRQMYDGADGRRPNLTGDHVGLFKSLVRDDFHGIADYLSRLPADGASTQ